MKRVCGLIPAAGRGSRLELPGPKILAPLGPDATVWSHLHARLAPHVDHVHVVLSPEGRAPFERGLGVARDVSTSVQETPTGMGDAIFGARDALAAYDDVLIVWGDQAGLAEDTVVRTLAAHRAGAAPRLTIPLVTLDAPYVAYQVEDGRLVRVLESREGDTCGARGRSDVGVFCASTRGLAEAWDEYACEAPPGRATGERNFLPFLPFLVARGFAFTAVDVRDPDEARGLNTAADLAFFRARHAAR